MNGLISENGLSRAACIESVAAGRPIVHCITNFVTVNDCANIILAAGGSPTMSRHPAEVQEITSGCSALVLNMGTISDVEAMILAGKKANELGHPVILDPVGAGASAFRRDTLKTLLNEVHFTAIRGNATEIRYLYDGSGLEKGGVDAALSDSITRDNLTNWGALAQRLAKRLDTVICISGAIDIAADSASAYAFPGGSPLMSRITGSGCMLTALMGAFLGGWFEENGRKASGSDNSQNGTQIRQASATGSQSSLQMLTPFDYVIAAQAEMNAAGEIAAAKTEQAGGGTMTFRMHLIDAVSLMTGGLLNEYAKVEKVPLCDL